MLFITGLLCTASAQADFATVAGTAQPNAIGHLLITFTGAEGKPEAKEFSVYFSGPDPKVTDTVFIGRTGLSADLVAGTYDIKVPVHPILWMRNVVIEEGKTTNMDVGGYGRIRINAEDSSGQPLEYDFKVWTRDDKKDLVIQGSTNIPSEYVLAGTYDIEVETEPVTLFEAIEVLEGNYLGLDLPQTGRLDARGTNALGQPLKTRRAFVFKSGQERMSPDAKSFVNKPKDLQPGIYDIQVDLEPEVWFKGVAIASGKDRVVDLPALGRLMVRGKDAQGAPINGFGYALYETKDGQTKIGAGDINVGKDMVPGVYDIKLDYKPEAWFKGVEIKAGKVKAIDVPPPAKVEAPDKPAAVEKLPAQQGRIQILGKNAMGEPLEGYYDFYVYPSGDRKNPVAGITVKKPIDLPPGVYDVKAEISPDVWFESVEVTAGQIKSLEVSLPGRLTVTGRNALGDAYYIKFIFSVYASGQREKPIVEYYINNYKDLPEGVYDVHVDLNPEVWYEGVKISAGEHKKIELPTPGRLEIRSNNAASAPLGVVYTVYPRGKREKPVITSNVNSVLEIQPGIYDVIIDSKPDEVVFKAIEIVSRQSKVIELPQPGRLLIMGKDNSGKPLSNSFTVYDSGRRDKETASGLVNEYIDLPSGSYDVKVELEEAVWREGVEIVSGQVKMIDLSKPPKPAVKTPAQRQKIEEEYTGPTGTVEILGTDAQGDPLSGVHFFVYHQGEREEHIAFGDVNVAKGLPPGVYDIEVTLEPRVWYKAVEITEGQSTVIDLSRLGRLEIWGKNAIGEPLDAYFFVYIGGYREKVITVGDVNEPEGLLPGTYDIEVKLDPHVWYEGIQIKGGQSTVIDLPQAGRLEIRSKDIGQGPLQKTVWLYAPGDRDKTLSSGYTNKPVDLWEGAYDIVINLDRHIRYEGVEILAGQTKIIDMDQIGYVQFTAVPKDGGEPFQKTGGWRVYLIGEDGKPEENYTAFSYTNPSTQFILPSGHYLATIDVEKGRAEMEFELKAEEAIQKTVVVNAEAKAELKLDKFTFIPGEEIVVHFIATADFQHYAWAGIVPSNIEHGEEDRNDQHDTDYEYLKGQHSGSITLTAPQNPGQYDIRMHDSNVSGREVASVSFTVTGQPEEEVTVLYMNAAFKIAVTLYPGWEMRLMPGFKKPELEAPEQGKKLTTIDSNVRLGPQVSFFKTQPDEQNLTNTFDTIVLLAVHDITKNTDETSAEIWIQNEIENTRKSFPDIEISVPPFQTTLNGESWTVYELKMEKMHTIGEEFKLQQLAYVHLKETDDRRFIYVFAATALENEFETDRQAIEAIIHSVDLFE